MMNPARPAAVALAVVLALPFQLLAQAKDRKVDGHPNTSVLGWLSGYNAARKWALLILLHGSGDRAENMFPMWRTTEWNTNFIVAALNSRTPPPTR